MFQDIFIFKLENLSNILMDINNLADYLAVDNLPGLYIFRSEAALSQEADRIYAFSNSPDPERRPDHIWVDFVRMREGQAEVMGRPFHLIMAHHLGDSIEAVVEETQVKRPTPAAA
jgi:hypothetical protein